MEKDKVGGEGGRSLKIFCLCVKMDRSFLPSLPDAFGFVSPFHHCMSPPQCCGMQLCHHSHGSAAMHCPWARVPQLPVAAHRAVRRHWYFRKVLKIIKNLSSLFFKRNAAKEKRNARRRKYPFWSLITPSMGVFAFILQSTRPAGMQLCWPPGILTMQRVPCTAPAWLLGYPHAELMKMLEARVQS